MSEKVYASDVIYKSDEQKGGKVIVIQEFKKACADFENGQGEKSPRRIMPHRWNGARS